MTWKEMTAHGDRRPEDYGPPERSGQAPPTKPMTEEEQEDYFIKNQEMLDDGINPVY